MLHNSVAEWLLQCDCRADLNCYGMAAAQGARTPATLISSPARPLVRKCSEFEAWDRGDGGSLISELGTRRWETLVQVRLILEGSWAAVRNSPTSSIKRYVARRRLRTLSLQDADARCLGMMGMSLSILAIVCVHRISLYAVARRSPRVVPCEPYCLHCVGWGDATVGHCKDSVPGTCSSATDRMGHMSSVMRSCII